MFPTYVSRQIIGPNLSMIHRDTICNKLETLTYCPVNFFSVTKDNTKGGKYSTRVNKKALCLAISWLEQSNYIYGNRAMCHHHLHAPFLHYCRTRTFASTEYATLDCSFITVLAAIAGCVPTLHC